MAKETKIIFDPNHPHANVHGMVGENGETTCLTRNPEIRCTGCCKGLYIPPGSFSRKTHLDLFQDGKQPDEDCPERQPESGCKLINQSNSERPYVCNMYHCSRELRILRSRQSSRIPRIQAAQKLFMESGESFLSNEIDFKTHQENLNRIPSV